MSRVVAGAEIRWNVRSEPDHPEVHEWRILLINRPERIDKIWQRFLEAAQPLDDMRMTYKEDAPGEKLEARLYTCKTYRSPKDISWTELNKSPGKITRDEELRDRTKDGLLNYVKGYVESKPE